jgi:2-polyprenyl-6-methoxyphenol hydroxylase-like FAD-dependent oxidoreductase
LQAAALSEIGPLVNTIHRISSGAVPGHAAFYRIPRGDGGAADRNGGLVNFACYFPVARDELDRLLVDRGGRRHVASLAAGALRAFASEHLPSYFAEIASRARDPFVQAIFTACVPHHHRQRICVLGDAATLAPPFNGSGVLKATSQAIDLARRLRGVEVAGLSEALTAWDRRQTAFGDALFRLAEHMEEPFIWRTPNFATFDAAEALHWWQAATTLPPAHARSVASTA